MQIYWKNFLTPATTIFPLIKRKRRNRRKKELYKIATLALKKKEKSYTIKLENNPILALQLAELIKMQTFDLLN